MLTVPTALWAEILARGLRPVEVYEIEAFAGRSTLYYSSQTLTWDGNNYVGLAVARESIKQSMDFKVPDCRISFANATNVLRAHLTPTDTLTGARLTVRLLFRNSSNVLLDDSLILFRGIIEPPAEITAERFDLSVVGLLDGGGLELPARRFSITCPWQFANGGAFDGNGHCSYVSNTLANGAGASTTTLLIDAASTFKNGDIIKIGSGAAVAISSGAGTTTLTLAEARTWADNAPVRYADCPGRTRAECEARDMLHRFGGFPGIAATNRLIAKARAADPNAPPLRAAGDKYADPTVPVPVLYGRLLVTPRLIEFRWGPSAVRGRTQKVAFFAVSEGEIDSIVRYFLDGAPATDTFSGGDKKSGIYYRDGDPGVDDIETAAEYDADEVTQLRAQNTDYRSLAIVAYSETAYLIYIADENIALVSIPNLESDAKGVEVQKYTAGGSTDGAKAWSTNPLWQACDLVLSDKHGLALEASDLDFSVIKPEADACDPVISSTEASTTVTVAQGSATTRCLVLSTEGFIAGKALLVNGVANSVAHVKDDVELTLGSAVTQSVGHTVVQRQSRFESHVFMKDVRKAIEWFRQILTTCLGYVTYDAGKIQFRIERAHVAERLINGSMESWASSTNLNNWTENLGSGNATITQDASSPHGGTYSARTDRTGNANFAGIIQSNTGFEPGRWYRFTFWHRQSASSMTDGAGPVRLRIRNVTQNLGVGADGYTWETAPAAEPIVKNGSTSWTQYEFTFKIREDFLTTDSIEFALAPYFAVGNSVWHDDASLRGPYAGDFREVTTDLNMGWKDGSFAWSLDRKDRETNRVAIRIENASNRFGRDEAAVDDFTHQQTHPIKTLRINSDAIDSRDQAVRIARVHLSKRRTLGPGCQFTGSIPALAAQPGDVILVSDTVPSWTCKEQRVIETEILGLGDPDEHFVVIRTEDYQEGIYSDSGPLQNIIPPRPSPVLGVNVTRNSGGVLTLTITIDNARGVLRYDVHMSDTTGFEPDPTTLIGHTFSSRFTYTAHSDDLDVLRYFRVVAFTGDGDIMSDELATTIFRAENTVSGYSDNFQFPTTLVSPSVGGDDAFLNEAAGAATVAKINDASDATYLQGTANMTGGVPDGDDDSIHFHTFGSGTHTGRPYVRAARAAGTAAFVKLGLYYTMDRTAGTPTWVLWQTVTSATITDYYGPEVVGADYTKFAIRARVFCQSTFADVTDTVTGILYRVAFDEKA